MDGGGRPKGTRVLNTLELASYLFCFCEAVKASHHIFGPCPRTIHFCPRTNIIFCHWEQSGQVRPACALWSKAIGLEPYLTMWTFHLSMKTMGAFVLDQTVKRQKQGGIFFFFLSVPPQYLVSLPNSHIASYLLPCTYSRYHPQVSIG